MRKILIALLSITPLLVQAQDYNIDVTELKTGVFVYTSYTDYDGNKVGANGLVIETEDSVVIVDTPWNIAQTQELIDWAAKQINKPISYFVITHAHDDRIGGISLLKEKNIRSISSNLTADAAVKSEFERPDVTFVNDTVLHVNNTTIEIFYPGPGHTDDNVAVYVEGANVLYGGCFLKSASARDLGNIADADLERWPVSVVRLRDKFHEAETVIPGHGYWEAGAIENTIKLLESH